VPPPPARPDDRGVARPIHLRSSRRTLTARAAQVRGGAPRGGRDRRAGPRGVCRCGGGAASRRLPLPRLLHLPPSPSPPRKQGGPRLGRALRITPHRRFTAAPRCELPTTRSSGNLCARPTAAWTLRHASWSAAPFSPVLDPLRPRSLAIGRAAGDAAPGSQVYSDNSTEDKFALMRTDGSVRACPASRLFSGAARVLRAIRHS